jgi:hypothetical protein
MSVFCLKAAFPSSRNGLRDRLQALESPDFRPIERDRDGLNGVRFVTKC